MSDLNLISEAITEYWGVRCDPIDLDCPCCRAWEYYDHLVQLQEFYTVVADLTLHHDVIFGSVSEDDLTPHTIAAVTANRLGEALGKVDKEWYR